MEVSMSMLINNLHGKTYMERKSKNNSMKQFVPKHARKVRFDDRAVWKNDVPKLIKRSVKLDPVYEVDHVSHYTRTPSREKSQAKSYRIVPGSQSSLGADRATTAPWERHSHVAPHQTAGMLTPLKSMLRPSEGQLPGHPPSTSQTLPDPRPAAARRQHSSHHRPQLEHRPAWLGGSSPSR